MNFWPLLIGAAGMIIIGFIYQWKSWVAGGFILMWIGLAVIAEILK